MLKWCFAIDPDALKSLAASSSRLPAIISSKLSVYKAQ
jgi:hypothetical protein